MDGACATAAKNASGMHICKRAVIETTVILTVHASGFFSFSMLEATNETRQRDQLQDFILDVEKMKSTAAFLKHLKAAT